MTYDDDGFCDNPDDVINCKYEKDYSMGLATLQKLTNQLNNVGYRDGKQSTADSLNQKIFDSGFHHGMIVGRACGNFYASLLFITSREAIVLSCSEHKASEERHSAITTKTHIFDHPIMQRCHKLLFSDLPGGMAAPIVMAQIRELLVDLTGIDDALHELEDVLLINL